MEGFGAHSRLHTAKILRLSTDLPIVIEIVDTDEKIQAFLPLIDDAIGEGLATLEKVEVRFYRSGQTS
jgi:PII-like signaling protein